MSGRCDECGGISTELYCVDCSAWPAEIRAVKAEGAAEEREAILKELQVMSCGCSHKVRARREKKL